MTSKTATAQDVLPTTLKGSVRDYRLLPGSDLLARVESFYAWQNARRREALWPYARSTSTGPRAICTITDDAGRRLRGINFGSQDYLSLSSHPDIAEAAHEAIERYGVHSAGSPAFIGNTSHSLALERELGEFLEMEHVMLYPTGYAAGAGVIRGLVRANDHVVIDALAHACLQDGAAAATKNVYLNRHLDAGSIERWLRHIREKDRENAILVVTEGLFSMDSDTPDIKALHALCREYEATLLVDVAHDFGCLGDGRGHIGLQDALAHVDIVMGSFSKTFASNGGFVACRSRGVKEYLRYFSTPGTFSNALSPVQAAIVLKALRIVRSSEGEILRAALMANILELRARLGDAGLEVYGDPSAIVAVKMGGEALTRLVGRQIAKIGLVANMVEFPAVAKGHARFRLQVMARHTSDQIGGAVAALGLARRLAQAELDEMTAAPRHAQVA